MRKLIQASLLTLAFTASIYAGEMQQPKTSGAAASGEIQNGIIEIGATVLQAVLSLF